MDYLIGFIFGYFLKNFYVWLDDLVSPNVPDNYSEEDWDWIK